MKSKLILCKTCRRQIARNCAKCPQCGQTRTTGERLLILAIIGVLVCVVWGFIVHAHYAAVQQEMDDLMIKHGLNPKDFK